MLTRREILAAADEFADRDTSVNDINVDNITYRASPRHEDDSERLMIWRPIKPIFI